MARHILVIVSFLAIACAVVTSFEPSPLQDFCVADPTSSGEPDKNRVYRLSNTTADNLRLTCSVSTVGSSQSISSSQSKEFVALQQHTAQLTEKYDHLSAEYAQLKASLAEQRAESAQQKAAYEQLHEMIMNMATQSGTCAPNSFWPYNHQPPPPGSPPPPPAPPLY